MNERSTLLFNAEKDSVLRRRHRYDSELHMKAVIENIRKRYIIDNLRSHIDDLEDSSKSA